MALSKEIQGLDARINDSDVSDEVKNDILEQIKSIKLRLAQHKKKEEKKEEKKEDQKIKSMNLYLIHNCCPYAW